MMREFSKGDWVFRWCLVSDLNLSLEFIVSRPLICAKNRQSGFTQRREGSGHIPRYGYASLFFPRAVLAFWRREGFGNDH